MPFAMNGHAQIYYEVDGEGPPLVLLHGLTDDLHDWREFGWVAELQKEYCLILIDDAEAEIQHMTGNDNSVTTRWVFKGKQNKAWMGVAPNGKRIRVSGETVDYIRDGKIVESHVTYDHADLLRQLATAS